jgi:GNAT superfamily N-acetyltransferase
MPNIHSGDPNRHFDQIANWLAFLEDEPNTGPSLRDYYQKNLDRIIQVVAEDPAGTLLGFYWATRSQNRPESWFFYLYVDRPYRLQGTGRLLYDHLLSSLTAAGAARLLVDVWDDYFEGRIFAERRGFIQKEHHLSMNIDLDTFDDAPYQDHIDLLQSQGFRFTTMAGLGDTEEAQRKLYQLNDTAASETPGSDGQRPWTDFEDFRQSVVQTEWYKPAGQFVVIHEPSGEFAAMSAITRFEGDDSAYNLFTGVDSRFRGRKLGQSVKVLALRFAREHLGVSQVRTYHNAKNEAILAIDRKLGYKQGRGRYLMEYKL